MRLGIKGKQVLGVTSIVAAVVVVLSLLHLARLASVSLIESDARADLMAKAIWQRTFGLTHGDVKLATVEELERTLHSDLGLRSILESSMYSKHVTFAAIVNPDGVAFVHSNPVKEGERLTAGDDLDSILLRPQLSQLLAVYSGRGRTFEKREPLLIG